MPAARLVIEAPVERVWAALTCAEHIARWFAFDGAEVDLRPGGALLFRWKEHGTFHGRVEAVEPPRFFSYRHASLAAGEQPRRSGLTSGGCDHRARRTWYQRPARRVGLSLRALRLLEGITP